MNTGSQNEVSRTNTPNRDSRAAAPGTLDGAAASAREHCHRYAGAARYQRELYNRLPEEESLGAGIELPLGDYLTAKAKYAALEYRHGVSRWTAHTHSGLFA